MPRKKTFVDPTPTVFKFGPVASAEPEAVSTEVTILNQIRQDEMTIIWGLDDALPMHILTAVANSPTATACIDKKEMYTKGSGFSDEGLMELVVNKDGDTLWDYHCELVPHFVSLDGFSTNFKYSNASKIQNAYILPTAYCRFHVPTVESTEIDGISYNPYFGTKDFQQRFTCLFPLFNPETVKKEHDYFGNNYEGQAYFFGTKRTLYKHYPVPKFWSAKEYIRSDHKMGVYTEKLLDNGFFASVLMKVIGDPNAMSKHPSSMKEVTGTDGTKRKEPTLTNGQVFDKMMAANFSGVERAGCVMALWSMNLDQAVTLEAFPNNTNPDLIDGTLIRGIRMISLATEVPAILANLPDTTSPLSGQDALPKAIDFMQANTAPKRAQLEKFYNTILLPNLEEKTKAQVKITQYMPTKVAVTIDDKFWEFMNEAERVKFIEKNEPSIELVRTPAATLNTAPPTVDENGNVVEAPIAPGTVDENLKNMKVSDINRIMSYVNKYEKGLLTLEQAKQLLSGFGLNEEQQTAWLTPTV